MWMCEGMALENVRTAITGDVMQLNKTRPGYKVSWEEAGKKLAGSWQARPQARPQARAGKSSKHPMIQAGKHARTQIRAPLSFDEALPRDR